MIKKYMGIDPGSKGAIVVLKEDGTVDGSIRFDTSTDRDVSNFLKDHCLHTEIAILEKVHSMPGQGVSSTFKFGEAYGRIQGMMLAIGVPFDFCTPRVWQKQLSINKKEKSESSTQWKNRLKQNAERLFPNEKIVLANADSFLIAEYCRRVHSKFFGQ